MSKKTVEDNKTDYEVKSSTLKINDMTVNIKSCFFPEKELSDSLFLIANTKLKEKLA